jgi:hypothetical protein
MPISAFIVCFKVGGKVPEHLGLGKDLQQLFLAWMCWQLPLHEENTPRPCI